MKATLPTPRTKKALFVNVLLFLGAIIFYIVGIQLILYQTNHLAEHNTDLAEQRVISDNLESVRGILIESSDDLWLLDSYYLRQDEVIFHLQTIESYANSNNVEVELNISSDFEPISQDEDELISSLKVAVSASGNLANLHNFLRDLALDSRYLHYDNLSFRHQDQLNKSGWVMQLTLVSYHNK